MRPYLPTLALILGGLTALPLAAQQRVPGRGYELGIDTTNIDRSVRPQDDFGRFVNGLWIDQAVIPDDRAAWGSFQELRSAGEEALRQILEEAAAADAPPGSELRKIGDLYASFMDSARVESVGITPLREVLAGVEALRSPDQLEEVLGRLQRLGVRGPFSVGVGRDQKDSDAYIVSTSQAGLMLPDRDYYLREGEPYEGYRDAYLAYLTRTFELAAWPDPSGAARRVLDFETRIAEPQWDRARNRNRDLTYNKMTVADLASRAPAFDWRTFIDAAGLADASEIIVRQPDYFETADDIAATTPVETWRDYLASKLIRAYTGELPAAFVVASFDFFDHTLRGLQEDAPRWRRGYSEVENALGEALGKIYVERHFQPAAKARMDTLVANLREAFRQGIDELEWMSPETKRAAHDKLNKFTVKIGYPKKWRDYSALEIRRDDLFGNAVRTAAFQYDDNIQRLGKPVDRAEWGMTPQTVNAYYNSVNNEIVFPAGILQPPFFNAAADDAVNYGGIGAVIGHEMSHGFDDQGRKSDGDGNLRDWWTESDADGFTQRATMLSDEYTSYAPFDDLHLNGERTLGENIGDLSGLAVAYRAYIISLGDRPAPVIGGFTGQQRFFMGWAQVWRRKARPEALRQQLLTDAHSPAEYRAFVPLTNMDEFYQAWDVGIGDGMYRPPEERVKIW